MDQFGVGRSLSHAGSRRCWLRSASPSVEPGGAHRGTTPAGPLMSPMATRRGVPSGPVCSGCTATARPSGRGHRTSPGSGATTPMIQIRHRYRTARGVTEAELPQVSCFGFPPRVTAETGRRLRRRGPGRWPPAARSRHRKGPGGGCSATRRVHQGGTVMVATLDPRRPVGDYRRLTERPVAEAGPRDGAARGSSGARCGGPRPEVQPVRRAR